jgi:hypothetical protein
VLVTWTRQGDGEIYHAVLSNTGSVVGPAARLSDDGVSILDRDSDAALLSNGRVVVAWAGGSNIRFVILDDALHRVVGPTTLENPAAAYGNASVSVVSAGGSAVLTWKDAPQMHAPRLYYALVDSDGRQITRPMAFYTDEGSRPVVQTSAGGYGNTSYNAPSPTATPSPTHTRTPTATATASCTPSLTPSPIRTETPRATPTRITVYLPAILKAPGMAN